MGLIGIAFFFVIYRFCWLDDDVLFVWLVVDDCCEDRLDIEGNSLWSGMEFNWLLFPFESMIFEKKKQVNEGFCLNYSARKFFFFLFLPPLELSTRFSDNL
jgi:hypothetical protein